MSLAEAILRMARAPHARGWTRRGFLLCLSGLVAPSGCSQLTGACTDDLRSRLTPHERTLRVGESFTPELALFGCGGTERLTDTITWAAADVALQPTNDWVRDPGTRTRRAPAGGEPRR